MPYDGTTFDLTFRYISSSVTPVDYIHFYADRYQCSASVCSGSTPIENNVLVAFVSGTVVTTGQYYVPSVGSGVYEINVFHVTASTTDTGGLIMQNLSAATCTLACGLSNPV